METGEDGLKILCFRAFFAIFVTQNARCVISPTVSTMKVRIFVLFLAGIALLFCLRTPASAQAPGMLEFQGKTVKNNLPLSGATVTVYRNGTIQQEQVKTGKNGKFKLFLVFGTDYKITFSYPGCVDMHLLVYTSKLPKERGDLFPLYVTEIPFFETSSTGVRIAKFKNPFTKIIYDGKKAFMDDEAYLAQFTKDLIIDPAEQARIAEEKEAREKAEKEKLEAAEQAKRDAEAKARADAEAKLLAEQKARADELAKAAELARLKAEEEENANKQNQTMETDAIRLQREKELKEQLAKKNTAIKTKYVNDLLKLVAENERLAKEKAMNQARTDARSSTVIEQMRRESELKSKAENLREEQKMKKQKELVNKQYKINEMKKLVEAAAFAERSVKISHQTTAPDVSKYKEPELPNVAVTVEEGFIKTVRTTVVTYHGKITTYRKEIFFWGSVIWYKDNKEIDEATYNVEIAYYIAFRNK